MKRRCVWLMSMLCVLVLLTGCSGSTYKKATELYENGSYEEAAAMFEGLGDYEDSAQMAQTCTYEAAKARYDAEDYAGALELFQKLDEDYEDVAQRIADTNKAIMLETYADAISRLSKKTWYFGGDDETVLNKIEFSEAKATISQVYFDGNGRHENGSNTFDYVIDDTNVSLVLADGSEMAIPYKLTKKSVKLGEGEYLTAKQVEAGLQGHWMVHSESIMLGSQIGNEYHVILRDKTIELEYAARQLGSTTGAYYYYGPYQGSFSLGFGMIETEARHGNEYFFGISDGKPVLLHFGTALSLTDSPNLPGEDGYEGKF